MRKKKGNAIVDLTFEFSLEIIKYCESIEGRNKWVIGRQLMKSGTSIGANVREAQSAESKADFIHKLKIADKEACETEYWLELASESKSFPSCENLLVKIVEIKKLLSSIISSSKKR